MEEDSPPNHIGQALDRLPVAAEPSLGRPVGGRDERDQQERRQRPREQKRVAADMGQHRAGEGVVCGDCSQRQVESRGGEHGDPVVAAQHHVPSPPGHRLDRRNGEHQDEDEKRRCAEDVRGRRGDVGHAIGPPEDG